MMNSKIIFTIIFVISFLLNLFWEISHSLLYDWNTLPLRNDILFYVGRIFQSTFWDAIIIVMIFLIISLFNKKVTWITSTNKISYIMIIVFGLIYAVFIEVRAKMLNTWSYNKYMLTIFGIGLTPLIQIAITAILTLIVMKKILSKY